MDYPPLIEKWSAKIRARGLAAHVINVPLGHPDTGSDQWPRAVRPDGSTHTGTSLHPPAFEANCQAVRQLQDMQVERVFLDDDFRLATSPGAIGGCSAGPQTRVPAADRVCESQWSELLDAVKSVT